MKDRANWLVWAQFLLLALLLLPGDPLWSETWITVVALLLLSGRITVCTQCAARRDLTDDDLLPGVTISGAASYVDEVLADGVQALVY